MGCSAAFFSFVKNSLIFAKSLEVVDLTENLKSGPCKLVCIDLFPAQWMVRVQQNLIPYVHLVLLREAIFWFVN